MTIDGPGVLLRLGVGELEPLDFSAENFPPGSFVMGGSGKLIKVNDWTETVQVVDGNPQGDPVPTALVTIYDHDWYDSSEAPVDGGKSTALKASSFGAPHPGKGWPITFPMVVDAVSEPSEDEEPVVELPDLFTQDENSGTEAKLDVTFAPVEIPDAFVDEQPAEAETSEPSGLPLGNEKSGPHPSVRSKVGRLYNYVLESGGCALVSDLVKWANETKLAKDITEIAIKELVTELANDDWPIAIVNEGYENELVSVGGVVSTGSAPSKLESVVAEMRQKAIELHRLGVDSVQITVEFQQAKITVEEKL